MSKLRATTASHLSLPVRAVSLLVTSASEASEFPLVKADLNTAAALGENLSRRQSVMSCTLEESWQ